ncbi:MAG: sodium:proton antiporter [Gemmataceae bacterium]
MHDTVLLALAGIVVAGTAAQWLAWRLRIPAILLLLGTGLLLGPALGWLKPDQLLGDLFYPGISLCVAIILFEGGLGLQFRELKGVQRALIRLLTVGVAITGLGTAIAAHYLLSLPWGVSFVLGAVLTVTGPTVVGPLLRDIRLGGRVGALLRWEGIVIDPIGAMLTATMAIIVRSGGQGISPLHIVGNLAIVVVIGVSVGLASAFVMLLIFRNFWAPDRMHIPLTLGMVLAVFTLADWLHTDAGLVAVTVMGITLANQRRTTIKHVAEFQEPLVVILLSSLFIIVGARVEPGQVLNLGFAGALFVAAMVLVIRPVAVFCSTVGLDLQKAERLFLASLAPRGVVAAAVASVMALELVHAKVPGADRLLPVTVLTIIGTVVVYGLFSPWLARRLNLVSINPQGLLFVGASDWVRQLAKVATDAGVLVTLVDSDRSNVYDARMQGLKAVYGSILSEQVYEELDTTGLKRLIAATANDELNALACHRFAELFGRQEVYHLPAGRDSGRMETVAPDQRGRDWLDSGMTFREIARRFDAGGVIRSTKMTAEFGYAEWSQRHGTAALPLLILRKDGTVSPSTTNGSLIQPGDTIIALYPSTNGQADAGQVAADGAQGSNAVPGPDPVKAGNSTSKEE